MEIRQYTDNDREIWNSFVAHSKNGLFMFDRNYMEYHKDRFEDNSLMFFDEKNELVSLLPATKKEGILISHGGLTFGGFITDDSMKQHHMNDLFDTLKDYMKQNGFSKIIYKSIPHIYHKQPAEEDLYSLFYADARILKVEASTVINFHQPLKMPKGRKAQVGRARREGVEIKESDDFESFINLENQVLQERHDTKAVHSAEELKLLKERFPNNIKLLGAFYKDELIACSVLFINDKVVHTQYMAANDTAREIGALDFTIATVIETYKESKDWLDFGISTENGGHYLNEGLISQKEGFGGRTNIYQTWKIVV